MVGSQTGTMPGLFVCFAHSPVSLQLYPEPEDTVGSGRPRRTDGSRLRGGSVEVGVGVGR